MDWSWVPAGRRLVLCLALATGVAGCTAIRADVARPPSQAIVATGGRLERAFAAPLAAHPGDSGVAILADGPLAWLSRVALADIAERSIDLQYYSYENDRTGLILLERLKAAADRGVRVRLLIDDNNNVGRDLELAGLDRHPNIQVRIFNPLKYRERWARPFQYVLDLERANRRMHNKIYEVDGVVAIVGGRNIGDNYFNFERDQPNFRDLDLLVVGPASTDVGRAFDLYWNSPWAYPAQALVARPPTAAEAQRTFAALEAYAAQNEQYQRAYPGAKRDYLESLLHAHENLTWAKVEVVVDRPAKVAAGGTPHSQVAERLATEWRQARREVLAESAYFVPGPSALGEITAARRRGVRVAVLTNSLSSTDVAAVHAGYMKRRPTLLRLGVELHEFKRTPTERPPRRGVRNRNELFDGQSSLASLHAKALVFDREVGWVGSFNLDPRSRSINTEVGLLVHDAAFAERLARTIEANFAPSISWRVELDDRGRLVWRGERNGRPVEEHGEPDTTWGARALARALALLPGMDRML